MRSIIPSICWATVTVILFFMDTSSATSLCFFRLVGFDQCLGCGIGHSIHYTLRMDFAAAYSEHLLGIPATLAILWMIIRPFILKHTPYEPTTDHDAARHSTQ